MKQYCVIDGNNLLGKIKHLQNLPKDDKQIAREKLALMLERYFANSKTEVSLFLDGYPKESIRAGKIKILYSYNDTADNCIKVHIGRSPNPRNISLITSDFNLAQFGKKCSCETISSDEFAEKLAVKKKKTAEEDLQKEINNDEIKRLFGLE